MGKNKPNGFSLFVKEEHNRRKRAGQVSDFAGLFAELGPQWKALSDEVKQRYKERATNYNSEPQQWSNFTGPPPNQSKSQSHSQTQPTSAPAFDNQPTPSTSDASFKHETKVKQEPFVYSDNEETKPIVKQERGEKRSHQELEVYRPPGGGQADGEDGERPWKKPNFGYKVPNFKNLRKSTNPDADRYFDYELFKKRELCKSIIATRAEKLMTMPIYSFSCNVMCKHKQNPEKKWEYVPIEIGIYSYTIENGSVGEPYSVIINSGEPPKNCFNDSNDHAKANHKIGFTRAGGYPREARNDYKKIYREMLKYVKPGERTILVADPKDIQQVELCIEWMYERTGESNAPKPSTWSVLPLVEFVTEAYNYVYMKMLQNPQPRFALNYFLKLCLETSQWDYEPIYMCQYHQRLEDQSKWCAQSCAIRSIKAVEAILGEIYSNYQLSIKPPEEEREEKAPPAPTATRDQSVTVPHSCTPIISKTCTNIQQRLQPLYRPRV